MKNLQCDWYYNLRVLMKLVAAAFVLAGLSVISNEYFRKGSYGLEQFTRLRINSVCNLVDTIAKRPKYYASIRENTLKVESMKEPI